MKLFFVCVMLSLGSSHLKAQEGTGWYRSFANSEALHAFYRYDSENNMPIVQGHRGTIENGFPESSIAGFEHELRQMPAIFEIDPRLTKDSVIIVFHDATLERTTNGTGKVSDYTWAELQTLHLKNAKGELTDYKIHSLAEILDWARGKTILILDKKDVPLQMIADIIRKHDAIAYVVNMVRSTEDALFYYKDDNRRMFSASIRKPEVFDAYVRAGIPKTQMFACVGTELNEGTTALCRLLASNGIRCLLATASSYDLLKSKEQRIDAYRKAIEAGISIIESNYPCEVGSALGVTHKQ